METKKPQTNKQDKKKLPKEGLHKHTIEKQIAKRQTKSESQPTKAGTTVITAITLGKIIGYSSSSTLSDLNCARPSHTAVTRTPTQLKIFSCRGTPSSKLMWPHAAHLSCTNVLTFSLCRKHTLQTSTPLQLKQLAWSLCSAMLKIPVL